MNKNTKIIYKRIEESMYEKGYVNLNHRLVNTKDDLVEIASIFRDERFETFRVIYVKDDSIVGYESITSRLPNEVHILKPDKRGRVNAERCYNKFYNRMNRLEANGYYLVHNHPSDNAKASLPDIRTTVDFACKVKGFKGHLIINTNSYAWISIDEYGFPVVDNQVPVNKEKLKFMEQKLKEEQIYDLKILSRDDFVSLMHNIKNSKDYSISILTDGQGRIKMVLDIPNRMINMPKEELRNYFRNIARMNGATRVFFATDNEEIYEKATEHLEFGTFKDLICYSKHKSRGVLVVKENPTNYEKELFESNIDKRLIEVGEDEEDYEYEPKEKQLRVLLKRVGEEPEVLIIENTLEAKQEIVDGLIEVVPINEKILIICNEEGKLLDLEPNLLFDYDYIAGDCFFVGDDYENGDFRSLTDDEIEEVKEILKTRSINYISLEDLCKGDEINGR